MKTSTMLLLAAGAFMLYKSTQKTAPSGGAGQPQAGTSLEQCLKTRDAATCAKLALDSASSITDAIASELKGIDGCAPASLEGHMASLGAYSGLNGSFYGSC